MLAIKYRFSKKVYLESEILQPFFCSVAKQRMNILLEGSVNLQFAANLQSKIFPSCEYLQKCFEYMP